MSECHEHIGEYEKQSACLVCLAAYWKSHYDANRNRIRTLEAQLEAARGLPRHIPSVRSEKDSRGRRLEHFRGMGVDAKGEWIRADELEAALDESGERK